MEVTWTRPKSVKVVKPASRQTACTRRLSVAWSSASERHSGWWRGPGERKIRSRESPDLACSGEMTSEPVAEVKLVSRSSAVDNKIKFIEGNFLRGINILDQSHIHFQRKQDK